MINSTFDSQPLTIRELIDLMLIGAAVTDQHLKDVEVRSREEPYIHLCMNGTFCLDSSDKQEENASSFISRLEERDSRIIPYTYHERYIVSIDVVSTPGVFYLCSGTLGVEDKHKKDK